MSTNDLFLLLICMVGAFDAVFATLFLPKMLAKSPNTRPEKIKLIQMACYTGAGLITVAGFVIHHLNIIK